MRLTCRALCAFATFLLSVPAADAEPERAAIVRVATTDVDLRPLAQGLTVAIEQAVKDQGYAVEVTEVALGTIKTMLACDPLTACLRQLGDTLGAGVVVAGQISRDEGSQDAKLVLLWVTDDDVYRDRFTIADDEPFTRMTAKMQSFARHEPFEAPPLDTAVPAPDDGDESPDDVLAGQSDGGTLGVPRNSWILVGSGAATVTVGALLLRTGLNRQGDIDGAPTDTVADLEALRDEEAAARRYNIAGTTLLLAGGAALITGAVMAVRSKRSDDATIEAVVVSPPGSSFGNGLLIGVRGSL